MRRIFQVTFIRFIVVGVINTLFGWCVYSIAILVGLEPWMALLIGNVMGIAFNFLSTGGYVFRNLLLARLPRFVLTYISIYVINLYGLSVIAPWALSPIWAQLVLTPLMAVLSYVLLSRFVFFRGKGKDFPASTGDKPGSVS